MTEKTRTEKKTGIAKRTQIAKKSLTGIKPTGMPHLGNWLGAIQPALQIAGEYQALYFIADYHALTTQPDAETLKGDTYTVAAAWLAMGLDPDAVIFYRQSRVPAIFELSWFLSCFTPKGFMNRAHGYKDRTAKNRQDGNDPDEDINMGFYSYPVLMSADILLFQTDVVPIGADQKQHLEFARDIADRINRFYGSEVFKLPEPLIQNVQTVVGLDGRKMSKSYGNTIPLFLPSKQLRKLVMKIVTNSQTPEEPKNPDESYVYALHQLFLSEEEKRDLRNQYTSGGMGWGNAKTLLYETLEGKLSGPREKFEALMKDPGYLEEVLSRGEARANEMAEECMDKLRRVAGLRTVAGIG